MRQKTEQFKNKQQGNHMKQKNGRNMSIHETIGQKQIESNQWLFSFCCLCVCVFWEAD